jgi:hypothetical protein
MSDPRIPSAERQTKLRLMMFNGNLSMIEESELFAWLDAEKSRADSAEASLRKADLWILNQKHPDNDIACIECCSDTPTTDGWRCAVHEAQARATKETP